MTRNALERLALHAEGGELWQPHAGLLTEGQTEFARAASPEAVLALCERIDRLESALMDIRALPTEHMGDAVLLANEALAGR